MRSGITPVIVELNHDTVRELRGAGQIALLGDITREEVLLEAGVRDAYALFITASLERGGKDVVQAAQRLNPELVRRGDMLDQQDVIDILAIELLGIVPEDQGIVISTNKGNPAAFSEEYEASKAFWRIGRRIRGEIVPIPNFSENGNLWSRLGKMLSETFRRRGA